MEVVPILDQRLPPLQFNHASDVGFVLIDTVRQQLTREAEWVSDAALEYPESDLIPGCLLIFVLVYVYGVQKVEMGDFVILQHLFDEHLEQASRVVIGKVFGQYLIGFP